MPIGDMFTQSILAARDMRANVTGIPSKNEHEKLFVAETLLERKLTLHSDESPDALSNYIDCLIVCDI